jgi:hypothetical protein
VRIKRKRRIRVRAGVPVPKRDRVDNLVCLLRKMRAALTVNHKPQVTEVIRVRIIRTILRKRSQQRVERIRINRGLGNEIWAVRIH